jgi:hypothetical protein
MLFPVLLLLAMLGTEGPASTFYPAAIPPSIRRANCSTQVSLPTLSIYCDPQFNAIRATLPFCCSPDWRLIAQTICLRPCIIGRNRSISRPIAR